MSFFDLIENTDIEAPGPAPPAIKTEVSADKKADLQQKAGRRSRKPRAERLKFLKPCPICQGTRFTHHGNGGFFCDTCQPGIDGVPVIASGDWQPPEIVEGLPCAGCGSTTYTKIKNGFIFDDWRVADGWHCGGKNCSIKLLAGNKKADQGTGPKFRPSQEPTEGAFEMRPFNDQANRPENPSRSRTKKPAAHKKNFRAAFPWITEHLEELLLNGWTRPELFRRSRCRWPVGPWGIAWLSTWTKPGLDVAINSSTGAVTFTFTGTHGGMITQTVQPGNHHNKSK